MLRRTRTLEPGAWAEDRGRPRILVEDPDGAVRTASQHILERAGYEVVTCAGPEPGRRCAEVAAPGCALLRDADVVYTSLDWHRPEHREVLRAQRAHHPDLPVVVEISRPEGAKQPELLAGCEVVHLPADGATMVAAVRHALG